MQKLSKEVRELGFSELPLPVGEWLKLRETILSMLSARGGSRRLNLPPVIVSCALCHAAAVKPAFEMNKAIARGQIDHYCSAECSQAHHATKNSPSHFCARCGAFLGIGRKVLGKYCTACLADRRAEVGRLHTKHPAMTVPCATCNTPFRSIWRGAKAGKYATYCSKFCADIGHATRMLGAGNPKYKHGATPARTQPHAAKSYRLMRPLVLARDNHCCVACGVRPERPHVHHIDNWPGNNAASNLVTLCPGCHRKVHAAIDFRQDMTTYAWLSEYAKRPLSTILK